jgi:hypothetical protein
MDCRGLRLPLFIVGAQLGGAEEALVHVLGPGTGIEAQIAELAFIPPPQGHDPVPGAEASRRHLTLA